MRLLFAVLLAALPVATFADQSAIHLDHAWSRAALAGHEGAVYLTIVGTGTGDTLTGITTPVSAKAELHQSVNDHGVVKMRPVADLSIEPGKPVTLAPGGYHIMLMDLKQPLKQGDSFPITLSFAKAGQITATVTVEKAGAPMPTDHGNTDMGTMPMPGRGKPP
jgi:copper(I)-binding protein